MEKNNIKIQGLKDLKIGVAFTGSFCCFEKGFALIEELKEQGADLTGIMSFNASTLDTKFGLATEHIERLGKLTGNPVIKTIPDAEPIGPKNMFDFLVVAPCTGNTAAKLANSITDTPVTMAVKSHLRGQKPVILAICTNDAESGSAKNIALLKNMKNYIIVPSYPDDIKNKPFSLVADFKAVVKIIAKYSYLV